jgi:hypothetical protein
MATTALAVAPAGADTPDPSPWPSTPSVDPGIDATAHSLRVAGPDRTQTALASALLLRGDGGYPFATSDRTSGPGVTLATAEQWWGLGSCPFAIIVTAGDSAADSLAAASLSDPTDGSTEPQLVRSASADEFLDPVGATSRVDTDSAPIIVTASTRQGATALSPAARTAVADLADGGCNTVDAAIVVGGTGAVPAAVDQQLLGLGVDEVFRVAGDDRFGTAARIARALGTGQAVGSGTRCADVDAANGDARMGFHGNAAVELRRTATRCQVLGRTVVLTDGITGADALAAGWWTSTWQVPVLLVDGAGEVPSATLSALNSLVIDNVIVLGGQARIPDATVAYVEQVTGAQTHRVAGEDRYATSVQMAQAFGGWFPTLDGADHDGSMVCLASSSGTGQGSVGWPDALGAGPWCAAAGGLATARSAPVRGLPPTSGPNPKTSRGLRPSHDAVPVLLTPAGDDDLAPPVAALLAATFDPADVWCSSLQASSTCLDPGFVVAFGGSVVLTDEALRQAAQGISGQTYVTVDDQVPGVTEPGVWTDLDLRPVFAEGGVAEDATAGRVCTLRSTLSGVRWLGAYADLETARFLAEHDVFRARRYVVDGDGTSRSPGVNAPVCLRTPVSATDLVNALGTSLSGHTTTVGTFDLATDRRLELSEYLVQEGPELAEGADPAADGDDLVTRLVFTDASLEGVVVEVRGQAAAVTSATVDLVLTRGDSAAEPDRFTADVSLGTVHGTVVGRARGEALLSEGTWALRGRFDLTGGTHDATQGAGGFRADLATGEEAAPDEVLTWRTDAVLAPSVR